MYKALLDRLLLVLKDLKVQECKAHKGHPASDHKAHRAHRLLDRKGPKVYRAQEPKGHRAYLVPKGHRAFRSRDRRAQ